MFVLKRNDTSSALLYAITPASVSLVGATVVFNMRDKSTKTAVISRSAAVVYISTVNPTVRYNWLPADTDTAGTYEGEFEVTYSDGTIQTYPNTDYIDIKIYEDIA